MKTWKRALALVLALVMALSLVALPSFAEGETGTAAKYNVIIRYVFENGNSAASDWTATIDRGTDLERTIKSPDVTGYTPDPSEVKVSVQNIQKDVLYKVTYKPAQVSFTVEHYQQNLNDDKYTKCDTVTKTGFTESPVGENLAETYEGFTVQPYDTTTKIAADGSTVVQIYYDRNYYLLNLDLAGGWGADPIYARYGTPVKVTDPTKPGYTFGGWNPALPGTITGDSTHVAQWNAGTANYTVQYWQENADDDGYSLARKSNNPDEPDVEIKTGTVGTKVSGSDARRYEGFTYNGDKTDTNVEIKGDGSTVVNVYYKRNVYTVNFYKSHSSYWGYRDEYTSLRITAKYGANINDKWPTYNGSSTWNVDSNTYQSNIFTMPLNGAKFYGPHTSNYSETAYYYVQVLPGETGTETKDGVSYKLHHSDTFAGSGRVSKEDQYAMTGFTFASGTSLNASYDGAKFYYTRNQRQLVFNDGYNRTVSDNLYYQQPLSASQHYKDSYKPAYPSGLPVGAYEFGGWHADPGCTTPVNWNDTMLDQNRVVYAKWSPKTFTVTYAVEEGLPPEYQEPVGYGELAEGHTVEKGQYNFVGWFYRDEQGNEHAFNTESMAVTKDMNLYAKWNSNVMVPYTIRFQLENGTIIGDPVTGYALAGTTKTFDAKTGTDLYEVYRDGYFPKTSSHNLKMDIEGTNEYVFEYVQLDKVPYTVKYLNRDTGESVAPEKSGETANSIITENAVYVRGYVPDASSKRLVLSANGEENVLIFYYTKDTVNTLVTVRYWQQNAQGDGYTLVEETTETAAMDSAYTADKKSYDGFNYARATAEVGGNVQKTFQANETVSYTVPSDNLLVLNLYYDRIEYNYEFRFVEDLTGTTVADPVTGAARYGSTVVQGYKNLESDGYALKEGQSENAQITVTMEAGKNIYTFHYMPFFNVVEVKNGNNGTAQRITMTNQHMDMALGGFSLTDMVPEGYLYGGAFEADHTTPIDFAKGQSGLRFVPTRGVTYYIWEPNAAVYLMPKSLSGWEHRWVDEELKLDVNSFYLVAPVDRTYYKVVGFTVNGEVDVRDTHTNMDDKGARTSAIYESIVLPKKDGSSVTYGPTAWSLLPTDLLGCAMAGKNLWKDTTKTISYVPYWVTLDGVKVTGAASRTYQYVENTKGLERKDEVSLTSTCTYTPDEPNNAPMRLLSAYIADSTQYTVTFHDNGVETAVTVRPGSVASCQPAGVSGKLFAGWYADADCTQPADLTAVEQDMDVYAKYVSDSYLTVKYNKIGLFRPTGVNLITAVDSENFAEVGFVINGEKVPVSDYTYRYRLIFTAGSLFGGDVARKAPMVTMGYSFNGAKSVTVAPYWVTNDGTTVTGVARTLTVSGWSIKG